jgi:EpsI family protein
VIRPFVAVLVLLAGILVTHNLNPQEAAGLTSPLREFPSGIDSRQSEDLPFENEVVEATGSDDYINREYYDDATPSIELYIGYYKNQSSGDRIHSPKNCLPGSGWEPVSSDKLEINAEHGLPVVVNEYVVRQGTHRDLVLYWYQSHGRIVASEYLAKFWLVADGLRHRSTDGAMIRIWTTASDGDANARTRAVDFARHIYPQVAMFLSGSGPKTHTEIGSIRELPVPGLFALSFNRGVGRWRSVFPSL